MQNHPFYKVDPAMLPRAGVKCDREWRGHSHSLNATQEKLARWHVDQQHKTLARMGLIAVSGGATPRGGAAKVFVDGAPRLRDARQQGYSFKKSAEGLDRLIDKLRGGMRQRGIHSLRILEDFYRAIDADSSGLISQDEFKNGLIRHGFLEDTAESDVIFQHFDEDNSREINWHEFLDAMKGQLNDARKAVVREAFAALDVNGDGVLSVEDLRLKFHSFAHPDVQSGSRTEDEVFAEFLDLFDNISKNGEVTLAEFERFNEYQSALIPSDEMFIATVRNAWRLHGATGGTCLKLRITRGVDRFRNPKVQPRDAALRSTFGGVGQTVQDYVEIRPDLGISTHDPCFFDAVKQRLVEMGYTDVTYIEVVGRE